MSTRVLAITSGKNTPSSRYRIRQHIKGLAEFNIQIDERVPLIDKNKSFPYLSRVSPKYYLPLYAIWQAIKVGQRIPSIISSYNYDCVWLNRELLTGFYTLEGCLKKKLIFDVDDAIWLNPPFGFNAAKKIAILSDKIVCGNEYLADWFSQYNKNCVIIPTSVDTEYLSPLESFNESERITIGWVGTHGNLKYLEAILPSIIRLLDTYVNVRLLVVSDVKPCFASAHKNLVFRYWSSENERINFQSIDIGLMPLENSPWANGKCSYKLLQHMSCGSPVVGSPVGMNKNVLNERFGSLSASNNQDWFLLLEELIKCKKLRQSMGISARRYIMENYSNDVIQSKLAIALENI